ncbi:MAG: hypothetical protein IMZ54_10775 [Acidobacteria bacterium]|nr:hypothetical protein [Acidobacteriota bacterium]
MSKTWSHRPLVLAALAVFLAAPIFSEVLAVGSRRAPGPVKIDGRGDDWPPASPVLEMKTGVELRFQNDGRNLYILLVLKKLEALKSAEATGMTVFHRPLRGKKPGSGVFFLTKDVPAEDIVRWRESQGALLTDGEKAEIRKSARQPLFLAFAVGAKGSMYGPLVRRQIDTDPPDFVVSREAGEATYEFRIPLASPESVPGGIGAEPGQTIRISFDWGGTVRGSLSTKASREAPSSESGYVSGTGRTWGQEFLDTFDSMSRPSIGTGKYSFAVDVKLADIK